MIKKIDFAAIDFETANYEPTSACAVGLTIVKKGKIADSFCALIKPEPFYFVPQFIDIHGIKPEHTAYAPDFSEIWPEIEKRIKGLSLFAHNAPFDQKVLLSCLRFYGIKFEEPEFFCTCRLAREQWPHFPNHKLSTVCEKLDISLKHHQADSDALACAKIALKIMKGKED
ncbi:MAG: 3'-5' exonuclease [Elusimicrobia bacterium]|nr:3'-5' exonuclease [Elusimicrobiota bacterium]